MRYEILNHSALEKRARRTDDPRYIYYVAILESSTFADYMNNIRGKVPVYPSTYNDGREAISPHREFRYVLRSRKWIAEVQPSPGAPTSEAELRSKFEWDIAEARSVSSAKRRSHLATAPKKPERVTVTTTVFRRNAYVVAEVLERAAGRCERCKQLAPFAKRADGEPYLEVHHKILLADDGDDTVENAIALCPNCHRWMHFGIVEDEHH
ncbi:MAG: HNH endonuclease signature motif containing protein [Candidatus Pacebacteria bacterium]|nr:HNH endonuclease signature motif containing protein [Candidatus Paceibacterota bacterium]